MVRYLYRTRKGTPDARKTRREQERVDGLPLVGLVGMNMLMRFRVTIDGDQGVLELTPGARYADPLLDAQHWVDADTSISRMGARGLATPCARLLC